MAVPGGVRRRVVPVPVDDLTVVLGLLGVVCEDHRDDAELLGIAQRTIERLRQHVLSLDGVDSTS